MIVADEVTLDKETHTYWTKDGQRVVGFHEVAQYEGWLGNFSSDHIFAAMKRGSNVHLAIHYLEKGTLNRSTLSDRIRPYVESYEAFKDATKYLCDKTEVRVFDPSSGLACTVDNIGMLNGSPSIIEIKTGTVPWWAKYQTAAAANGLPKLTQNRTYKRFALELRNDGKPARLTPFKDPADLAEIRICAQHFYVAVKNGAFVWPRTIDDFKKQQTQEEQNGLDDFFNRTGGITADGPDVRNGEGDLAAVSRNGSQSSN